jgi:hypothetical protein
MIRLAGCLVLLVLALGCSDAHGATPPADHWGFSGAAAKQFDAAYSACRKEESANAGTGTETPSSGGNGYIGQLYELQAKPPAGLSRPQLRAWWTGCQGGLGTPERFALQAGLLSLGRPSVDVDAGSYRGVSLGDPAARALRRFGRPRQRNGVHTPSYPVGTTFENGGPHLLRNPDGVEGEPDLLRYQDVAVLAGPGGISAIVIDDPAAARSRASPLAARSRSPGSCIRRCAATAAGRWARRWRRPPVRVRWLRTATSGSATIPSA